MKFQPRPRFEDLAVRGRAHFSFKAMRRFFAPPGALKAAGAAWRPLERPGSAWKRPHMHDAWMKLRNLYRPCISYGLQYILCLIYGFRVWGTLNWDLRWIMTRALLRDTRSVSYRSVARPQYTFRLLVKSLWTPEGFQAPNAIH